MSQRGLLAYIIIFKMSITINNDVMVATVIFSNRKTSAALAN